MRVKKNIVFVLTVFTLCFSMSMSVFAETLTKRADDEVSLLYLNATKAKSLLTISSNTASCKSECTGKSNVVEIAIEQTLQKHGGLWIWNDVDEASQSTTKQGKTACLLGSVSGLDGGTYRLESVFTLTTSSGETETVTVYSDEKKVM